MANKNLDLAPVLLFVYNRPDHTRKILHALKNNLLAPESTLYIYADGPKNDEDKRLVDQVYKAMKETTGFKEIIIKSHVKNIGLARSVIEGVSEVVNKHGSVIVLEDDIYTSSYFLTFMNEALGYYRNEMKIFSISGYSYPISIPPDYSKKFYFHYRSCSWGWATWADRWNTSNWDSENIRQILNDQEQGKRFKAKCGDDLLPMTKKYLLGKIDSWAIRWAYTHFIHDGLCVYPLHSLVKNIGMDGSGTHFKKKSDYLGTQIGWEPNELTFDRSFEVNPQIHQSIHKLLDVSIIRKVINRIFLR
ncbi:MAG: sugar transferase [Bacteroidota bacterium]